jgi:hypothetical protein
MSHENLIFSYTRAQAIDDGVLVDLTLLNGKHGNRQPFNMHVACTSTVFEKYINWPDHDGIEKSEQAIAVRVWDVLYMAALGARTQKEGVQEFLYIVYSTPPDVQFAEAVPVKLKCHIGPGDQGEPVITIMLPHED